MSLCDLSCVKKHLLEEGSIEGQELKNTIVITFAFQFVFTAFNALQNLHSSLHDEENLGLVCLSVLYGTGILSSIFAPTIIGLFGTKRILLCSFTAHCVYILANFYPSFATMIPTAILLGVFHGPAWTSQGLYISACAFSFSKSSSSSPYSVLYRFNNLFFAVFATTQIFGNLATSLFIRDGVGSKDEMFIFKYCGPKDCPANENATEIEDPDPVVVDITLGFFMACALCGLLLTFFLLTPLPKSDWIQRVHIRKATASFLNVSMSTNMLMLAPFIVFTAVEHGFLLGSFTKSYVTCPIGIHMVGFVMSVYGATTPIFFFLFLRLARVAGRMLLILLSAFIHLVLFIVLFIWEPKMDDEALIFLMPMVWGVAESILQAQANGLIAILFPNQKEPAFANYHAWRSLGYCLTFLNVAYMCVSAKLIICMVSLTIGTVLYVCVEIKTKMKEKLSMQQNAQPPIEDYALATTGVELRKHSNSNRLSVQDRLSFDHFELVDIIKDAEHSWTRQEGNLKLDVEKVMSEEHLRDSKVTTLYHTRPVPVLNTGTDNRRAGHSVSRSKSDTHLITYKKRSPGSDKRLLRFVASPDPSSPNASAPWNFHKCDRISEYALEPDHGYETCFEDMPNSPSTDDQPSLGSQVRVSSDLDNHLHSDHDGYSPVDENNGPYIAGNGSDKAGKSNKGKSSLKRGIGNLKFLRRLSGGLTNKSDITVTFTANEKSSFSSEDDPESLQIQVSKSLNKNVDSNGNINSANGVNERNVSFYLPTTQVADPPSLLERRKQQPLPQLVTKPSSASGKPIKKSKKSLLNIHGFSKKSSNKSDKSISPKSPTNSSGMSPNYLKKSFSSGNINGRTGSESDYDSDGFVPDDDYDIDEDVDYNNLPDIITPQRKRKRQLPVVESEDVNCIY